MSSIDVATVRADTPGCEHVAHFNSAGASLMPTPVIETVIDHLRREADVGGYRAADEARDRIEGVYGSLARLVGGTAHEIAVVENATRAWDMLFYSMAKGFHPGKRILTSRAEYASNVIAFLQIAGQTGVTVETVPDDEDGQISIDALTDMVDDQVALIAINHIPTQGGLIAPVVEVGRVARAADVPFLLDACQSVGHVDIDVAAIGCTALTATSRKFLRGPRGMGFLWLDEDWIERLEPPFLDLHAAEWTSHSTYVVRGDARRFENWETNVAAKLGLGSAADYALAVGMTGIERRVKSLGGRLREALATVGGVQVHDQGRDKGGIVTFTVDGIDSARIADDLRGREVNVSVSTASSARFDLEERGIDSLVRASAHYFNTEDEVDDLVSTIGELRTAM